MKYLFRRILLSVFAISFAQEGIKIASFQETEKQISFPYGPFFAKAFDSGKMRVLLYTPKEIDKQQPHEQDEVYVIISGKSQFTDGEKTHEIG